MRHHRSGPFSLRIALAAAVLLPAASIHAFVERPDFNGDSYADLALGVPFESVGSITTAGSVHVIYGSAGALTSAGNQLWHQDSPSIAEKAEPGDEFGFALAHGDFDNDGYSDLAIGAPFENLDGKSNPGAVHVLYGSASGLSGDNDQLWHQDTPSVFDQLEANDKFGSALAAGDFNDDGFDDLVIGVMDEDINGMANAGAVHLLYGSAAGLTAVGDKFFHQDFVNMLDNAEAGDHFGYALTTGDFNGDGIDDLAIGVPEEDLGVTNAGAVAIMFGSITGLTATGNQLWHQDSGAVPGANEESDTFGYALAAGDFDGDAIDDLAVGAPFESIGGAISAGSVTVLFGSVAGLTDVDSQMWTQTTVDVDEAPELADAFGWAIAAGDFNNDGMDELAIGSPLESVDSVLFAGAVFVLMGSAGGPTSTGAQLWHQDVGNIADAAEEHDWLGHLVKCADVNGDGFVDLIAGAAFEDIGTKADAGAISVILGSVGGLTDVDNQFWHQDSPGILETAQADDGFGYGR